MVVPRLVRTLSGETPPLGDVWDRTVLALPSDAVERYRDVLTDRQLRSAGGAVALADVLAVLPVAVLEPT